MATIDITNTASADGLARLPLTPLRWSAIVAGLVVGISSNLLLALIGTAAGLAVFDLAAPDTPDNAVPIAAAVWNAFCMIASAFAGAYVAARTSGMRRTSDGVLHGVVAWGVTLLLSTFLVTSIAGATLGGFVSTTPGASATYSAGTGTEIAGNINAGNRQEAIAIMRDRLGLTAEQAGRLVDQALVLAGQEENASPEGREAAERTVRVASMASGWLSGAILLSLAAAVGGGMVGAHGTRRRMRRLEAERTVTATRPV